MPSYPAPFQKMLLISLSTSGTPPTEVGEIFLSVSSPVILGTISLTASFMLKIAVLPIRRRRSRYFQSGETCLIIKFSVRLKALYSFAFTLHYFRSWSIASSQLDPATASHPHSTCCVLSTFPSPSSLLLWTRSVYTTFIIILLILSPIFQWPGERATEAAVSVVNSINQLHCHSPIISPFHCIDPRPLILIVSKG